MGELNIIHKGCKLASGCVIKTSVTNPFSHKPTAEERKRERERLLHAKTWRLLQQFVLHLQPQTLHFRGPKNQQETQETLLRNKGKTQLKFSPA